MPRRLLPVRRFRKQRRTNPAAASSKAATIDTTEAETEDKKLVAAPPESAPVSQAVTTASQGSGQAGIWVSGIGAKEVEADVAVISLGVESREKTVAAAQRRGRGGHDERPGFPEHARSGR